MDGIGQSILAFIAAHQGWTPVIMVVFAAAETTAFLSILVPSTAVLVGVGALVATGVVPFWPLWVGASLGALIGSTFSYWLGRRYGGAMLQMRPLIDHPDLIERARTAFAKWGPVTVLFGHFIGPLRPVVFLMAGMSGMRLPRFMIYNVTGALAWAYLIPKIGQYGGDLLGWLWSLLPF